MPKSLSSEMKHALRVLIRGEKPSFTKATHRTLVNRGLVSAEGELSEAGRNEAIVMLPLKEQCAILGLRCEKLELPVGSEGPEAATLNYFKRKGYVGACCEGGPVLLLIRAAALDLLAEINTFRDRSDACKRFTEAQLMIHKDHARHILDAIKSSSRVGAMDSFSEIYQSAMVRGCYPGLNPEVIGELYESIGANCLAKIAAAIMENPYCYRAGWPDLTMTKGRQMLWVEVKTTDRIRASQVQTISRMKPLLPGEVIVVQLYNYKAGVSNRVMAGV